MINRNPNCSCVICKSPLYRSPSKLNAGAVPTCSIGCRHNYLDIKNPERIQKCYNCSKTYRTNPAYVKRSPNHKRFCSSKCSVLYRAKNSVGYIDCGGYKTISVNNIRYREHRYLVEQKLGRKLNTKEHVHHIDGNKLNNSLDNLEVLTASDHQKLHGSKRTKAGFYAVCKCCGISKYKPQSYLKKYKRNDISNYRCMNCWRRG